MPATSADTGGASGSVMATATGFWTVEVLGATVVGGVTGTASVVVVSGAGASVVETGAVVVGAGAVVDGATISADASSVASGIVSSAPAEAGRRLLDGDGRSAPTISRAKVTTM